MSCVGNDCHLPGAKASVAQVYLPHRLIYNVDINVAKSYIGIGLTITTIVIHSYAFVDDFPE